MSRERVLLLVVDGIGDVTIPSFGDRTPLEVAHTPHLDAIAAAGLNGLLDPVEPGLACGSDTSHMNIFGYDPRAHYRGRGAFESMGAGIPMAPGDIAFKCNFATLDVTSGVVTSRRADRRFEHIGPELCAALDGLKLPSFPQHTVTVAYATEHRCGIAIRGPGLCDAVGGTDPLKDNLPLLRAEALDDSQEARHTAAVVNELSDQIRSILEGHPINAERAAQGLNVANVVLLRGCGTRIKVPSFQEVHGMKACLVAPTKIIAGLGMSFDIDRIEAPGATGFYNSAFHNKASTICEALTRGLAPSGSSSSGTGASASAGGGAAEQGEQQQQQQQQQQPEEHPVYEFGFLHIKAVDDTGHDRRLQMKVRFQEVVDAMVAQIIRRLSEAEAASAAAWAEAAGGAAAADGAPPAAASPSAAAAAGPVRFTVVVTGDHSTPVQFGDHSHEPVPFAIAHVRHVVQALGGPQALRATPLAPIPLPDVDHPPEVSELCRQAIFEEARRKASWAGRPWDPMMPAEVFGPWKHPWPQAVRGDPVRSFDELSAARGALGRFTGSEVMKVIKQFAGVTTLSSAI